MLVPTDLPQRIAARGVPVNVVDGWESRGGSADHRAVVFHWTASSRNESPSSCANYSFISADNAPHYNVVIDRTGVCWLGARDKSNSSGEISGVALNETLAGNANVSSAASRGLDDSTSANAQLFAISAQNDGVGEPWSAALVDNMSIVCAVVLDALGIGDIGYLAHHASLTSRKIDLTPGHGCPDRHGWYERINGALGGGPPAPEPEVPEMFVVSETCPPGESRDDYGEVFIGLPYGRKSARVDLYVDCATNEGVSCWVAVNLEGKNHGLWGGGNDYETFVPGHKLIAAELSNSARGIHVRHMGGTEQPLMVTVSGT